MSEFGALFQQGAGLLHQCLGSSKTVSYTPPVTQAVPSPASQALTQVIISDVQKTERDESDQAGNHLQIAAAVTVKRSEISRFSNKGKITIDNVDYPILDYIDDEDAGTIHIKLDFRRRTQVTGPNFIRAV